MTKRHHLHSSSMSCIGNRMLRSACINGYMLQRRVGCSELLFGFVFAQHKLLLNKIFQLLLASMSSGKVTLVRVFLRQFWNEQSLDEVMRSIKNKKTKQGQWCNRNNESPYEGGSWSRCSVGCSSGPLWEKDWCFSSFFPAAPFLLLPSSPMSTVNLTWTWSRVIGKDEIKLYIQWVLLIFTLNLSYYNVIIQCLMMYFTLVVSDDYDYELYISVVL